MLTLPMLDVQLNPLDALLAGVGYRLIHLSKSDNQDFLSLIEDKDVVLQFVSDDGVARFYAFRLGQVTQSLGKSVTADLTVKFQDSTEGAKLLAKADVATLMRAIQDGQMVVEGDYKLMFWFVSLAKHITKVPDEYASYIDKAKPMLAKAKPYVGQAVGFVKTTFGRLSAKLGK